MVFKSREFVRIQDLTLNYALPVANAQKVNLQRLSIFGSVRNLATFTKWPAWDPESAINQPMPRTYTMGVNLTL